MKTMDVHAGAEGTTLADIGPGERRKVKGVSGDDAILKQRLMALGLIRGVEISVDQTAPFGDPRVYNLMGYRLTLRNADARQILIDHD